MRVDMVRRSGKSGELSREFIRISTPDTLFPRNVYVPISVGGGASSLMSVSSSDSGVI